jgi:hypothetical protein
VTPKDISFLSSDLQAKARFWENGEVMWPKEVVPRVIDALAGASRIIHGQDVEKYAADGTFIEWPWSVFQPDRCASHEENVERSRTAALDAVARIEATPAEKHSDDWVNVGWSDPE